MKERRFYEDCGLTGLLLYPLPRSFVPASCMPSLLMKLRRNGRRKPVMYEIDSPVTSVTRTGEEPESGRRAETSLSDRDQTSPVASGPPQECEWTEKEGLGGRKSNKKEEDNPIPLVTCI